MLNEVSTSEIESILLEVLPGEHQSGFPQVLRDQIVEALGGLGEAEYLAIVDAHGEKWGHQPRHETSTKILTGIVKTMIGAQKIEGAERIYQIFEYLNKGYAVTMVSNHLSYGDINYLQAQMSLNGFPDLPLLVMAGPKVFRNRFRKLSALSFETLKMAQPPSRASDGADVTLRELAEVTRQIIEEARFWMEKGRVLFCFPEGSRSRTGILQRFVSASARYCSFEKSVVFPVGFAGTEGLLSLADGKIHFDDIHLSLGAPLFYSEVENKLPQVVATKRKAWMDVLGYAVAAQVPKALRGIYNFDENKEEADLELARQVYLTIGKG